MGGRGKWKLIPGVWITITNPSCSSWLTELIFPSTACDGWWKCSWSIQGCYFEQTCYRKCFYNLSHGRRTCCYPGLLWVSACEKSSRKREKLWNVTRHEEQLFESTHKRSCSFMNHDLNIMTEQWLHPKGLPSGWLIPKLLSSDWFTSHTGLYWFIPVCVNIQRHTHSHLYFIQSLKQAKTTPHDELYRQRKTKEEKLLFQVCRICCIKTILWQIRLKCQTDFQMWIPLILTHHPQPIIDWFLLCSIVVIMNVETTVWSLHWLVSHVMDWGKWMGVEWNAITSLTHCNIRTPQHDVLKIDTRGHHHVAGSCGLRIFPPGLQCEAFAEWHYKGDNTCRSFEGERNAQTVIFSIWQEKVLSQGNDAYESWEHIPAPLFFHVYVFNLTNADEVANGSEHIELQEVGPYVFQDHREKIIHEDDGESITYLPRSLFEFIAERSGNLSLDDSITTVNVPLVVCISNAYHHKRMMTWQQIFWLHFENRSPPKWRTN